MSRRLPRRHSPHVAPVEQRSSRRRLNRQRILFLFAAFREAQIVCRVVLFECRRVLARRGLALRCASLRSARRADLRSFQSASGRLVTQVIATVIPLFGASLRLTPAGRARNTFPGGIAAPERRHSGCEYRGLFACACNMRTENSSNVVRAGHPDDGRLLARTAAAGMFAACQHPVSAEPVRYEARCCFAGCCGLRATASGDRGRDSRLFTASAASVGQRRVGEIDPGERSVAAGRGVVYQRTLHIRRQGADALRERCLVDSLADQVHNVGVP